MNQRPLEPEERKKIEAIRLAFGWRFGSVSFHPKRKAPLGGGGDGDMATQSLMYNLGPSSASLFIASEVTADECGSQRVEGCADTLLTGKHKRGDQ